MKQLLDDNNYKTYTCRYNYEGISYSINIDANSFEDAEKILKCIGGNGRVDGELILTIPIPNIIIKLYRQLKLFIFGNQQ